MLHAPHSPGSGTRAQPSDSLAAHRPPCLPLSSRTGASESKQRRPGRLRRGHGHGCPGTLAPSQFGAELCGWRLVEKGQLEAPRLRGPPPRPGVAPQARGCQRGRAESILASKKGSKKAAAIRGLTSLPTSVSFSFFYSFGFQIIGPEGGVQNWGSWRQLATISTLLMKDLQKGRRNLTFWFAFVTDSLSYLGQVV